MKTFFFFGDSLTLGVSDVSGGWTRQFALRASNAGLNVPPDTFYNLGVRRHSSKQVLERWEKEYQDRSYPGASNYLLFCFGVVDMAAPKGTVNVSREESVRNAQTILEKAAKFAPVLMLSPLPVANAEHCERCGALTSDYAALCQKLGTPFLDLFTPLRQNTIYLSDLKDGLHPGPKGNELITDILLRNSAIQSWLA